MKSEFEIAITQLSADRNLAPEIILEAIEAALVSAYKRNFGASQNVHVSINPRTGQARVFVKKLVVEQVSDPRNEISLEDARALEPEASLGDLIDVEIKPRNFGRIAAQTAKQVITQRIREAERDSVYLEFSDRAGEIVTGVVRNLDMRSRNAIISLGKAEALLPRSEQIPREHLRIGQRLRVYIVEVSRTSRGPQILVSRTHRDLLRRLFELEVPEIHSGIVEVKAIAREPGSRSKVAVAALQPGVDPVGSCVGMRGVRIQNIVNELSGEKIDVVAWSSDPKEFISNALSPARVVAVYLNELEKTAKVVVPDRVLSLAIGREGQNARLAARLTGWRIDIRSETEAAQEAEKLAAEMEEAERKARELEEARRKAAELLAQAQAALEEEEELAEAETLASEEKEAPSEGVPSRELDEGAPETEETEEPYTEEPEVPSLEEEVVELELEDDLESTEEQEAESGEEAEVSKARVDYEEEFFEEDWEEEDEDLFEGSAEQRSKKKRKRTRVDRELVFDERLGRTVARKRHKRRDRRKWEEDWEEWDE